MDTLINKFTKKYCKKSVPDVRTGYLVCVHQKIKEGNKERIQKFQGTVIKVSDGNGLHRAFTVRKVSEGIGVEKTYLLHSPNIVKIDVLRAHKVRRAKLYYLRDLAGKALRMREVPLKLRNLTIEEEAPKEEAAKEEKLETAMEEKKEEKAEEKKAE